MNTDLQASRNTDLQASRNTYLGFLDVACLFQLLRRLHYEDLVNICKTYNYLYSITCTDWFQEEWKNYNIRINITEEIETNFPYDDFKVTWHKQVDRLNQKHGKSIGYLEDGRIYYDYSYIQGRKHGIHIDYAANPDHYTLVDNFENGTMHGPFVGYRSDGSTLYRTYVNGKQQGMARDEELDQIVWKDCYDGNYNGLICIWYMDGTLKFMGFLKDNQFHGKCITYYPNGKRRKVKLMSQGKCLQSTHYDRN
jgi:antitoxin component YwqK of YwqJK toxin-antitoxin module